MKKQREKIIGYNQRPATAYGRGVLARPVSTVQTNSRSVDVREPENRVVTAAPTGDMNSSDLHSSVSQTQYAAFRVMSKMVRESIEYQPETIDQRFPLPQYNTPPRPKLVRHKTNWRRLAVRSLAFTLAIFLAGGATLGWRTYQTAGKVLAGTSTVAVLGDKTVEPYMLKGEGDGRVNILLLGIGGEGHDGSDLTDTIIVASVDPINKSTTLISVPRDLWVKMPVNYFGQHQKINAAFSSGKYKFLGKVDSSSKNKDAIKAGFASADTVVSQVLGLRIDYNVLINFKGFEQAIDTVGGVTVDVKDPLVDASMAWENGNNATLVSAGSQEMDGQTALLYARSRHTSSDFARSERQRQIIMALKDKVLASGTISNPMKINSLSEAFGDSVYTDLSSDAALRLIGISREISDKNTVSLDLISGEHALVTTGRVGDISIVRPQLGFEMYSDIHTYIAQNVRDGFLVRENAAVAVAGPTKEYAVQEIDVLKRLGYTTSGTLKTDEKTGKQAMLVDVSQGRSPYTQNYLENHYGKAQPSSELPTGLVVPNGTQFVILVGT